MTLGILHITDLHINRKNYRFFETLPQRIVQAARNSLCQCENIIIACTGDIAQAGSSEDYELATKFFSQLKGYLNKLLSNKCNNIIAITPGNHDLNFEKEKHLRKSLKKDLSYSSVGTDGTIIHALTEIQDDFFNFVDNLNGQSVQKGIFQNFIYNLDGETIRINAFNTAWCSSLNEQPGQLFYPIKLIENLVQPDSILDISIFHHHPAWLTPNSDVNNRSEFTENISSSSDLVLYGHEHTEALDVSLDDKQLIHYFGGDALYSDWNGISSGFQVLCIDTVERKLIKHKFEFDKKQEIFIPTASTSHEIRKRNSQHRDFVMNEDFVERLSTIDIPVVKETKRVRIQDLFIFPDIEKPEDHTRNFDTRYIDSQNLIDNSSYKIVILEGENQSGKTSLLKMLFLEYSKNGIYPILLDGDKLKGVQNFERWLKRAYEDQYNTSKKSYDCYNQFETEKKVVLVDNLTLSKLDDSSIRKIINWLSERFEKVIITISTHYGIAFIDNIRSDVFVGTILPLGHKKRGHLIDAFYKLSHPQWITQKQEFIENTHKLFDEVEAILGNRIIPSYPIFIISILQSMEMMQPANVEQTSYGYCYQTLIHYALSVKANIKNDEIDAYFNYLSELAYHIYNSASSPMDWIDLEQFDMFHALYCKQYVIKDAHEVKAKLISSHILLENEDHEIRFGYEYIFYFLVAKKIASLIHTEEGKVIIKKLYDNLHDDKCANILIFTTYHCNDTSFIESAITSSKAPFGDVEPVSLGKEKEYYNLLSGIANEISEIIIAKDIDPVQIREARRAERDKIETLQPSKNDLEYTSLPDELITLRQALRSIEIVGQIIKNRKGSITKPQLVQMVSELFNTAFRCIGFFGHLLTQAKNDIVEEMKEQAGEYQSHFQITSRVNAFVYMQAFNFILAIYSKVIHSVGMTDLKEIYNEVARQLGTPAAKILTFSINSCYGSMSISELKRMHAETKDNQAVMGILQARVRAYIYNNDVRFDKKQQIASLFNWKMENNLLPMRNEKLIR